MAPALEVEPLLADIAARQSDLIELTQALVRIPTVNPPGDAYEACARLLGERLRSRGFEVQYIRALGAPGDSDTHPRWNVVARISGPRTGPCVHFNSHLDVVEALKAYHQDNPDAPGAQPERLRLAMKKRWPTPVFKALVDQELAAETIVVDGPFLRMPGHSLKLGAKDEVLWKNIAADLARERFKPPRVRDFADTYDTPEAAVPMSRNTACAAATPSAPARNRAPKSRPPSRRCGRSRRL